MLKAHEYQRRAELRQRLHTLAETVVGRKIKLSIRGKAGGSSDGAGSIAIGDPVNLKALGFTDRQAIASALVTTVHEGAHIRYKSDTKLLNRYLSKLTYSGVPKEVAFMCLDMAEDLRIDAAMERERPGYGEQHQIMAKAWVNKYTPEPLVNPNAKEMNTLRVAAARIFAGVDLLSKNPEVWKGMVDPAKVEILVKIMEQARNARSCQEALRIGHRALRKTFGWYEPKDKQGHEQGEQGQGQGEQEQGQGQQNRGKRGKQTQDMEVQDTSDADDQVGGNGAQGEDSPVDAEGDGSQGEGAPEEDDDDTDQDEDADGASGEDDGDSGDDDADSYDGDDEDGEDDCDDDIDAEADEVEQGRGSDGGRDSFSGEHTISGVGPSDAHDTVEKSRQTEELEAKNFQTRRKEMTYYFDKVGKKPPELQIAERYAARDRHAGCEAFFVNPTSSSWATIPKEWFPRMRVARLSIARVLKDELRKSREQVNLPSKTGHKVNASKVWRATHLNREDVMVKKQKIAPGGWHVDIWIDASGSMASSASKARALLWVLIGALRDSGMNVRAFSWNSDNHVAGIVQVTQDHQNLDLEVNSYVPRGDNRDGFVLRIAHNLLQQVNEENKLLIWISDGLPANDGGDVIKLAGGVPKDEYTNEACLQDFAMQVRLVKKDTPMIAFMIHDGGRVHIQRAAVLYGREFIDVPAKNRDFTEYIDRIPGAVKLYLTKLMQGRRGV